VKKVCITGQNGFIGKHLVNNLRLSPEKYSIKNFENIFFNDKIKLENCVKDCDVIIHLAALNRHIDDKIIYQKNVLLVEKLINALIITNSKAQVIMSSSVQELENNPYGKSKKVGRKKFEEWSKKFNKNFVGMLIPNVFGPFGLPNYNSVVSTFCHNLINNESLFIQNDKNINLIYIDQVVDEIKSSIDNKTNNAIYNLKPLKVLKVSELSKRLKKFKQIYIKEGNIPDLSNYFDLVLFNTFRSYINHEDFFPKRMLLHSDYRGTFLEIIRFNSGGQFSFSTTKAGVVRGNHFHTRKIERFSVIKGKALVQLRKIGSSEILNFYLDGIKPSYIDIPVWFTHNILNIGKEELCTVFWINEAYNENDTDTFNENV